MAVTTAPLTCFLPPEHCLAAQPANGCELPVCSDLPCKLRDGLYIGSKDTEAYLHVLTAFDITHVLQVGGELGPTHVGLLAYHKLVVSDHDAEDLISSFGPAFQFIDQGRARGR